MVRFETPSSRIFFNGGSSDEPSATVFSGAAGSEIWVRFAVFSAIFDGS